MELKDKSLTEIVALVNVNRDKDFYTDTKRIEDQGNIYALVNKYNYVDMDYVPKNLKPLFNISSLKMVDVAADAYEEFVKGAKADGYTFIGTTAYRSATWQKQLYDSYVNKDGKDAADRYSARPGYSEHQLGYSVDLNDPTFTGKRLTDKDYEWIKNNCYKYGFIIRYPENKENITGYMHENWHLRYVGKDVAAKITEYKSLQTSDQMKEFLTASDDKFIEICTKLLEQEFNLSPTKTSKSRSGCTMIASQTKKDTWMSARDQIFIVYVSRDSEPVSEQIARKLFDEVKSKSYTKVLIFSCANFPPSVQTFVTERPIELIGKEKLMDLLVKVKF